MRLELRFEFMYKVRVKLRKSHTKVLRLGIKVTRSRL